MLKWPLVWRSTWALQAESTKFFREQWLKAHDKLREQRSLNDKLQSENAKLKALVDAMDQRAKRNAKPGSTKTCTDCGSAMIPMQSTNTKVCSNAACGKEIPWPLEEGQVHTLTGLGEVEPFVEDRSNDNRPLD